MKSFFHILRRDSVTYPLLFIAWAALIYGVNSHYSYFGTPAPGIDLRAIQSSKAAVTALNDTVDQARQRLMSEKDPAQRGRILEAVGSTFFRLHALTRKPGYLDSAFIFCSKAIRENKSLSSAYFTLGQIMSEKKEFASAQEQYEKAIACDPRSPLLCQTLGILLWFDLKQPDKAQPLLERALALDPSFPTANYVLGVIALDKNDIRKAADHFENELRIFNSLSASRTSPQVDQADIRMAACFSSLRLAFIYSTSLVDEQKAQDRFGMYLKLETDPQRRQASANQIQKYWKTNKP